MSVCVLQRVSRRRRSSGTSASHLARLAAPALARFCTRRGATTPAARDRILWTSARSWALPGGPHHPLCPPGYAERAVPACSAGCGAATTTAAGSAWSRTARHGARRRDAGQPACRPDDDHPAADHLRLPICKLYGGPSPPTSDARCSRPLAPGQPPGPRLGGTSITRRTPSAVGGARAIRGGGDPVTHEFPALALSLRTASRRPQSTALRLPGPIAASGT